MIINTTQGKVIQANRVIATLNVIAHNSLQIENISSAARHEHSDQIHPLLRFLEVLQHKLGLHIAVGCPDLNLM